MFGMPHFRIGHAISGHRPQMSASNTRAPSRERSSPHRFRFGPSLRSAGTAPSRVRIPPMPHDAHQIGPRSSRSVSSCVIWITSVAEIGGNRILSEFIRSITSNDNWNCTPLVQVRKCGGAG
jgi:hypothetical protein